MIMNAIDEFERLLAENEILMARTQGVGVLPRDLAINASVTAATVSVFITSVSLPAIVLPNVSQQEHDKQGIVVAAHDSVFLARFSNC